MYSWLQCQIIEHKASKLGVNPEIINEFHEAWEDRYDTQFWYNWSGVDEKSKSEAAQAFHRFNRAELKIMVAIQAAGAEKGIIEEGKR